MQESCKETDRDHYMTMRDITRLRQIVEDTEIRLDHNDVISIRLWSTRLQQDSAHVILKDKHDPPPLGSSLSPKIFVLCIQTKFQCERFQELSSDFMSIDATHNTTQYVGLQLFTIIVRDLWGHGALCGVFPLMDALTSFPLYRCSCCMDAVVGWNTGNHTILP